MLRALSLNTSPIVFKSGAPVSVVCVAATYTGVTYANNGGKVQLSSAGVHGLTTSPAVGASVYVSWAGGTGVSGLYTILSIDDTLKFTIDLTYVAGLGTPTVVVANTIISVPVATIPPLLPNSYIRISAGFFFTASANYKSVFAILNSLQLISNQTNGATIQLLRMDGWIRNYDSVTVQKGSWLVIPGGVHIATDFIAGSTNTAISSTLYLGLKPAAANEFIKISEYLVEVFI